MEVIFKRNNTLRLLRRRIFLPKVIGPLWKPGSSLKVLSNGARLAGDRFSVEGSRST